jgi:tellurite resistance protein
MKISTFAALVAAVALPAAAQTATPGVDQRQANQEARIQQGVKSGELTPKEAAKLEKGQAKVQAAEDKAKADGKVTPKERAKLAKKQNRESRKIYKEKHDVQKMPKAS